jgi:redox-sensitive bicupin YhaK (pirin superfamily)
LHFHRDVEIVTYVRSGTVAHEDVLGNAYELREGDVQAMTAGTGIRHSEYNRGSEPLRIFQLWFEPGRKGETPGYAMRRFPEAGAAGTLKVLASGLPEADGSDHLPLSAAARLLGARIARGEEISYRVPQGHKLYVVASRGELRVNDLRIREGDGVAVSDEAELRFQALADADLVIAEVP